MQEKKGIYPLTSEELYCLKSFMRPIWQETYCFLPKEQVDLLLDKYFNQDSIEKYLALGYEYYNLFGVGVLVIKENENDVYIDKLYLTKQARGKNYPRKAFEFLDSRGKNLTLNVNRENKRAVSCYLKNGFKIIKEENIDLGNGLVNCDYVMQKNCKSEKLIIRKCASADINALCDFYGEVVDYLYQTVNYPRWTKGVYPCRESITQAVLAGDQYGAFLGDNLVGAFVFNTDTAGDYSVGEWSACLKDGQFAVLHTLATHQNYYGRGIAKQMVSYCLNSAKEQGYKAVRLDVVPDNFPAIKLYSSFGFSFAGEKDLKRGFKHIPTFCLYEYNFGEDK